MRHLNYGEVTEESLGRADVTLIHILLMITHTAMFNVNLVTSKMKLQVASQDGSVLVAGSDHPGCPALSSPRGNIQLFFPQYFDISPTVKLKFTPL